MSDRRAVVLHSGGQDSTTCLAWAVHQFGRENVFPIIIDYGQRHAIEIKCAKRIQELMNVSKAEVLDLNVLSYLGGAALTDKHVGVSLDASGTGNVFAEEHDLPSTFVPGRNALFFSLAVAYGAMLGAYDIVTGVCEADRAGYPDCREEFVGAMQLALREALGENRVTIHAPLLHLDKGRTFGLANDLDVLDLVIEETHTCYEGDRSRRFVWGAGCGECPACLERANGWEEFKANQYQVL